MLSRCILLIMLAVCKGLAWALEQPLSSLAPEYWRLQELLAWLLPKGCYRGVVHLEDYGAGSRKPLQSFPELSL